MYLKAVRGVSFVVIVTVVIAAVVGELFKEIFTCSVEQQGQSWPLG